MIETDLYVNEELREAICSWLRANGVDPDDVPISSHGISVFRDQIAYNRCRRDANGNRLATKRLAIERAFAPLRVLPEGIVAEWLEEMA